MKTKAIEITEFTKFYNKKQKTPSCDNIDFYAEKNQITGILGPNGAGKSTLLKSICGVQYETKGSVSINGFTNPTDIRKICSYVPETPELDRNLTVKEILYLTANLYTKDKKQAEENIQNAVKICMLEEVFTSKASTLSKGFQQRVSLAQGICKNPEILVLDEFSAGLDPEQTVLIRNQIKNLAKSKTIIFSTHNIEEAVNLCDSIYIIKNGKIVANGTIPEILKKSNEKTLEKAYIKLISEAE